MTTQPALPGLASLRVTPRTTETLRAQAVALYRPLYGADTDSATIGVEVMLDRFGSLDAVIAELRRCAAQDVTPLELDRAA